MTDPAITSLCNLSSTGRLDHEPHLHPEPAEHVDQRLDAEEMQATPQEIADARLAHLQLFRELRLLQASRRHDLLNLDQEVRADDEVLGLLLGEAEIAKHVAARWRHFELTFGRHRSVSCSRARAGDPGRALDR